MSNRICNVILVVSTAFAIWGPGFAAAQSPTVNDGSRVAWPTYADAALRDQIAIDAVPIAGQSVRVELRRFEPITRDARFVVVGEAGPRDVARPEVAVFFGKVAGDEASSAFVSVSPFGTYGFVVAAGETHVISTGAFGSAEAVQLASLRSLPVGNEPYRCHTDESYVIDPPAPPGAANRGTPPCRTAVLAIETDYEYTANLFGGNVGAANAYIATLIGATSAIYTRDLNVRLQVGYVRLWETESDPWTGADTGAQLDQFRNYWNANMTGVYRHLAHYFSGRGLGGGVAWLSVVCHPTYGYGLSAINGFFPSPIVMNHGANWDLMVTAHELGHNFGAPHTHDMTPQVDNCANGDCSVAPNGTIMSYCHFCPAGLGDVRMELHPRSINEAILPHLAATCSLQGAPADGTSLWFDGGNDYLSVPAMGSALPTSEVTVEFWQYADDAWQRSTFGLNADSVNNRFQAHVPWTDGRVYWDLGNINTGGRLMYQPPVSIVGSWQHFALVASQNGNYMRIFRNGVQEAEKVGMRPFLGGNFEFRMGGLGTGNFFRGKLDEMRIWNVARTPAEIAANYNQVIDPAQNANLRFYWRFEEASGNTTTDLVAGRVATRNGTDWALLDDCANDTGKCCFFDGSCQTTTAAACGAFGGSFQGLGTSCESDPCGAPGACCLPIEAGLCAVMFENDCIAAGGTFSGEGSTCDAVGPLDGFALEFDGANDRVTLGNSGTVNFAGAISMEAWVRPDTREGVHSILTHGAVTIPPRETGLRMNAGNYEVFCNNGATHGVSSAIPTSDVGRWVHLAGVYEGGAWKLYRNGVLVAQNADATGAVTASAGWAIGSRPTAADRVFDGRIDEVRLWNRGRSAAEIAADFSRSLVGNEAGLVGYWRLDAGAGGSATDSSPFGNHGSLVNGPIWRPTAGCDTPCLGDLDGDGEVGLPDLTQLLSHFGDTSATPDEGDLNGDQSVDLTDLTLMLSAFGQTC